MGNCFLYFFKTLELNKHTKLTLRYYKLYFQKPSVSTFYIYQI